MAPMMRKMSGRELCKPRVVYPLFVSHASKLSRVKTNFTWHPADSISVMSDNDYASLCWAETREGGARERLKSIRAAHSSPPLRKGDLLWRNHDLCQRWEGCQLEQGMKVRANNDKCPPFTCPPSPPVHSSVARGEALQHFSPSLHCVVPLQRFHHPTLVLSCASKLSLFNPRLSFFLFFFHSRYSPLFFSGVAAHLLLSIPCDLCCCSWWIPMIQRFREQGARQSPLSCGWAICLCQTSPPPPNTCNMGQTVNKRKRSAWGREMVKRARRRGSNILKQKNNNKKQRASWKRRSTNPFIPLWRKNMF